MGLQKLYFQVVWVWGKLLKDLILMGTLHLKDKRLKLSVDESQKGYRASATLSCLKIVTTKLLRFSLVSIC